MTITGSYESFDQLCEIILPYMSEYLSTKEIALLRLNKRLHAIASPILHERSSQEMEPITQIRAMRLDQSLNRYDRTPIYVPNSVKQIIGITRVPSNCAPIRSAYIRNAVVLDIGRPDTETLEEILPKLCKTIQYEMQWINANKIGGYHYNEQACSIHLRYYIKCEEQISSTRSDYRERTIWIHFTDLPLLIPEPKANGKETIKEFINEDRTVIKRAHEEWHICSRFQDSGFEDAASALHQLITRSDVLSNDYSEGRMYGERRTVIPCWRVDCDTTTESSLNSLNSSDICRRLDDLRLIK